MKMNTNRKIKKSLEDKIVDGVVYTMLSLLTLLVILPFMQVITISMSPSSVVNTTGFHLIPKKFDFEGYKMILANMEFWRSYGITILRTVIGTFSSVIVTILTAYPLAKKDLPGRKYVMMGIVFTMYFSGGMIPTYLLIRGLHLVNNFWVYIFPCLVQGFALIITRNFFMEIPPSLEESAKIDGASNLKVLFQIYLPLSLPVIATISLWYGVAHWNAWMDNMLYVTDRKMFVLQYVLRGILLDGQIASQDITGGDVAIHTETMKMSALILSLIPIVSVYPFLQKYFVKGMLVGSVKG